MSFKWRPGKCCGCEKPQVDKCDDTCTPIILSGKEGLLSIKNWPCKLFIIVPFFNVDASTADWWCNSEGDSFTTYKPLNNISVSDNFKYIIKADFPKNKTDDDTRNRYDFPGDEKPFILAGFPFYAEARDGQKERYVKLWSQHRVLTGRNRVVSYRYDKWYEYDSIESIINAFENDFPFVIPCVHYSNLPDDVYPSLKRTTRKSNSAYKKTFTIKSKALYFMRKKDSNGNLLPYITPDLKMQVGQVQVAISIDPSTITLDSSEIATVQKDEMLAGVCEFAKIQSLRFSGDPNEPPRIYAYVQNYRYKEEANITNSTAYIARKFNNNTNEHLLSRIKLLGKTYIKNIQSGTLIPQNYFSVGFTPNFQKTVETITLASHIVVEANVGKVFQNILLYAKPQVESVIYNLNKGLELTYSLVGNGENGNIIIPNPTGGLNQDESYLEYSIPSLSGTLYPSNPIQATFPAASGNTINLQSNITASITSTSFKQKVPFSKLNTPEAKEFYLPIQATFSFTDVEYPDDLTIDGERYHLWRHGATDYYVKLGLYLDDDINQPIQDVQLDSIAKIILGKQNFTTADILNDIYSDKDVIDAIDQKVSNGKSTSNSPNTSSATAIITASSSITFISSKSYWRKNGEGEIYDVPFGE